jgi:type I pantothenate kinase
LVIAPSAIVSLPMLRRKMRREALLRQGILRFSLRRMSGLADVSDLIRARMGDRKPLILGITGAVAVGKSTFAAELETAIEGWPEGPIVEVVNADGFLHPNAVLEARGLLNRKGFPETYDSAGMRAALAAIRRGPTDFPTYSHLLYDIDPALTRRLERPDVLIIEGLGLHEGAAALGLDALIYLDADEAHVEAWFEERFIAFWRAAETDPTSFYARFRHMSEAEMRGFAGQVWRAINLPNLLQHIVHGRAVADILVSKGADHSILAVTWQGAGRV